MLILFTKLCSLTQSETTSIRPHNCHLNSIKIFRRRRPRILYAVYLFVLTQHRSLVALVVACCPFVPRSTAQHKERVFCIYTSSNPADMGDRYFRINSKPTIPPRSPANNRLSSLNTFAGLCDLRFPLKTRRLN